MLISLAVDHHLADLATRERYHPTDERIEGLYGTPLSGTVTELAMIATCNRTELYAWAPAPAGVTVQDTLEQLAERWTGEPAEATRLLSIARARRGEEAAKHLLRVAAGLESQVVGDGQILGQLRASYRRAADAGSAGAALQRVFDAALHVGKRVRSETALAAGRRSVGAAAVSLAARRFGSLEHVRAVVVGCGRTGERVTHQLIKLGARDIVLVNRSFERAAALAGTLGLRAARYESLHLEVAMADVAFVATAAESPIVVPDPLNVARRSCGTAGYPLLLFDLSLPRNVDAAVAVIPNVVVADLDALYAPVAASDAARVAAVPEAEAIVDDEVRALMAWLSAAQARSAIRPLRDALDEVCRREVSFVTNDEEVADRTAQRIVAKLMARPMAALRGAAGRGAPGRGASAEELAAAIALLFGSPVSETRTRRVRYAAAAPPAPPAPPVSPIPRTTHPSIASLVGVEGE